jgi:Fe-S cluster assembly protein SufD
VKPVTYGLGIRNRMKEFDVEKFSIVSEEKIEEMVISNDKTITISVAGNKNTTRDARKIIVTEGVTCTINDEVTITGYGGEITRNIEIKEGASVVLNRIVKGAESFMLNRSNITVSKNAQLKINEKITEGTFIRHHTTTTILENARLTHKTLFHTTAEHDIKSSVNVLGKNATARLVARGVVDNNAKGLFLGKVYMGKGATGSEGHQKADVLLLGENTVGEAVPILEVENDDVMCSHGATISRIDDEMLFYIMSRGVSVEDAKKVIVAGFVGEDEE